MALFKVEITQYIKPIVVEAESCEQAKQLVQEDYVWEVTGIDCLVEEVENAES